MKGFMPGAGNFGERLAEGRIPPEKMFEKAELKILYRYAII
jgi:hypothetical protein